ncbi:hypothetical protein N9S30_00405 [bacterium]|nr:hypothetical protein [bacterium]
MSAMIDDLVNARKRALGVQTDMMRERSFNLNDEEGEDDMSSDQLQAKLYRLIDQETRRGVRDDELTAKIAQLQEKIDALKKEEEEADVMQGRRDSEGGAAFDGMEEGGDDVLVDFDDKLADTLKKVDTIKAELTKQRNILDAAAATVYGIAYDKRMDDPNYPMWLELGEEEPRNQPSFGDSYPTMKEATTVPEPIDYERFLPYLVGETFSILEKAQRFGVFSVDIVDVDIMMFQIEGTMKFPADDEQEEAEGAENEGGKLKNKKFDMYPGSGHQHRRFDGLLNDTPYQHDVAVVRDNIKLVGRETTPYWQFATNPPRYPRRHGDIAASMRHLVLNSALLSLATLKTHILGVLAGTSDGPKPTTQISTEEVDNIKNIVAEALNIVYSNPADRIGNGKSSDVANLAMDFGSVAERINKTEVSALLFTTGWVVSGDLIAALKKSIVDDMRQSLIALNTRLNAIKQRTIQDGVEGNAFPMPPPLFRDESMDSDATTDE